MTWENKLIILKHIEKDISKEILEVAYDPKIASTIKINLMPKLELIQSKENDILVEEKYNIAKQIQELLDFISFNYVFKELIEYKVLTNRLNIVFKLDTLKQIIKNVDYRVISQKPLIISSEEDIQFLNNLVTDILKEYMDRFYKKEKLKAGKKNLFPQKMTQDHPNIIKEFKVKIPLDFYKKIKKKYKKL